ncbi:MAG TPA: hypothetical protein VGA60_15910 [Kiloniellales bacterium]|jgi:hypothetical protein
MGEIVDLESYRRLRKRRLVETSAVANRRAGNRSRSEHDRLRPAVEPVDIGRRRSEPAGNTKPDTKPDDKSSD